MKDQSPVDSLRESVVFSKPSLFHEEKAAHNVIGSLIDPSEGVAAKTAPFYIDNQQGIGALLDVARSLP